MVDQRISVWLGDDTLGQRIDRALVAELQGEGVPCTRSQLAKVFAAGGVRHHGQPVKPSRVLDEPIELEVTLSPPEALKADPEPIPLSILHEDGDVLVIDKAAGMVMHPSAGHPGGTLVNAVLHHLGVGAEDLPVLPGNHPTRPGIVHRIDRDTSGVVVVAKHIEAQERLAAQFRDHTIERSYLGVVVGAPSWEERRVETLHARDPKHRKRFSPDVGRGRTAISHLRVREVLRGSALIEAELETGRTHQIRMHARHLGHPILADAVYGTPASDPVVRDAATVLGRQALHAAALGFVHPGTDSSVRFEAPLPADIRGALAKLGHPR